MGSVRLMKTADPTTGPNFMADLNLETLSINVPVIEPGQLEIGLSLGEGAFCKVYESFWTGRYASGQVINSAAMQKNQSASLRPDGPLLGDVKIPVAVKVLKMSSGSSSRLDFSAWQSMLWEGQVLHALNHR
jgi:serine/threonine protein kinase